MNSLGSRYKLGCEENGNAKGESDDGQSEH